MHDLHHSIRDCRASCAELHSVVAKKLVIVIPLNVNAAIQRARTYTGQCTEPGAISEHSDNAAHTPPLQAVKHVVGGKAAEDAALSGELRIAAGGLESG